MEEKKQNKENTQTIWNEIFRLHIQTLLYTSFSQKTQSKGSYFYLCSKNTRALVQSLNWLRSDLVSDFEEEGKAERWRCDRLWLHIVSGWLSFTFLSCLSWCQTFYDFTGWDPKHLIQGVCVSVWESINVCVLSSGELEAVWLSIISFQRPEFRIWWLVYLSGWIVRSCAVLSEDMINLTWTFI